MRTAAIPVILQAVAFDFTEMYSTTEVVLLIRLRSYSRTVCVKKNRRALTL